MVLKGIRMGCLANLPVAASVAVYGSILGVLAAQKGLSWVELLVMNLSVFAGSAQFVMVDMWVAPLPIVEITLAVLVINFRYLLIGASLRPLFEGKSLWHKFAMMHLVADENWAVTMAEFRKGEATSYFLFGGGLCILSSWCAGTLFGHRLGAIIKDPEAYALDFVFIAVFTALAMSLWRGKSDLIPWMIAAAIAAVSYRFVPGKWYIVFGGLGGAFAAMFAQPQPQAEEGGQIA